MPSIRSGTQSADSAAEVGIVMLTLWGIGLVSLGRLFDQLVQWGTQSSDRTVILLVAGLLTVVVGLLVGQWLVRRLFGTLVHLWVWLVGTARDIFVDTWRRWRTSRPAGDDAMEPEREYLRVRPTSAEYDPNTLVTALERLNSQHRQTELSFPWRSSPDDALEVIAATEGADDGIEFYIGGEVALDRLAGALPYQRCGFDVDHVQLHPAHLLASAADDPETASPTSEPTGVDIDADTGSTGSSAGGTVSDPEVVSDGAGRPAEPIPVTEQATIDPEQPDGADADAPSEQPTPAPDDGRGEQSSRFDGNLTEALLAQWADQGREPVVYRLNTTGNRQNDWMMAGSGLTELVTAPADGPTASGAVQSGTHPWMPILRTLADFEGPAMAHVTFRSFRTWEHQVDRRQGSLEAHRDTLGQVISNWVFDAILGSDHYDSDDRHRHRHSRSHSRSKTQRRGHDRSSTHSPTSSRQTRKTPRMTQGNRRRFDHLEATDPHTTFVANVRLAALPTAEQSREDVAATLRELWADLDHLEGDYYQLASPPSSLGERLAGLLRVQGARHRQRLRRLCRRKVVTPVFGHTRHNSRKWWPDLVCSADELAAWTAIPSTAALPDQVTEHLPHRPAHTDPHEGLPPAIRDRYVGPDVAGVRLGYLLTDDGGPALDEPFNVPVQDQRHHSLALGGTGTGKSTDAGDRASQYPDETRGPTIIFTGPGANIGRYTMRALAARHGLDWLEEHVHWFPVPSVVPGVAPLNLESVWARGDIHERWDAVTEIRDRLVAILRGLMNGEAYDEAQWSKRVINRCIEAAFDPEYWEQNAPVPSRPGPDACQFEHIRAVLDRLAEAGQSDAVPPPQLSTDDDQTFERVLDFSDPVFGNIIGGAYGRLDTIADDRRRRLLFASREPEFEFGEILDSDDVYVFDLSALQDEPQQLMALTLVTLLNNALQSAHSRGWLQKQPDDYLVNVVIDEAAFVAGSDYFTQLLAEGRNYRIGLDLSTQYLEQFADEVDTSAMRNVIANTDTKLVGTHMPSDRLAEVLQPEGLDVTEVRQQVRDLPEAHRVALLPRQIETERPQLLTLHRGPLPAWHPDSDATPFDEQAFEATLDRIRERTQEQYGVTDEVRDGVYEGWDSTLVGEVAVEDGADRPLEVVMAEAIRTVQLQQNVREANGWIDIEPVDEELVSRLADDALEEQGYGVLPKVRKGSDLVEVDLQTAEDEEGHRVVTRLTAEGEDAAAPDTGQGQVAGGEDHDDALLAIEDALTACGFSVQIITQDGTDQPDALATHPAVESTFSIEAETTTYERPAKVLENLAKAQRAGHIPLFVVTGDDTEVSSRDVAQRVANILAEPVNQLASGETRLYTRDDPITVDGGDDAEELIAARPATGDSRETRWVQHDGEFVLESADGTEHARVTDIDTLSKTQVPAVYTQDEAADTYTVMTPGELPTIYESRDAFEADWVPIKRPFLPEDDLPVPDYTEYSYAIVMLDVEENEAAATIYDPIDETSRPLDTLLADVEAGVLEPAVPAASAADRNDAEAKHTAGDDTYGVGAFVASHVTGVDDGVVAVADVYGAYTEFALRNGYEVQSDTRFTQALKEHVNVESKRKYLDGDTRRCYLGIELVDDASSE